VEIPETSNVQQTADVRLDEGVVVDVSDLTVTFRLAKRTVVAVQEVGFQIERGRVLGLVGESGCGKSTTALAVMRLLRPPARIESGRVLFQGQNLVTMDSRSLQRLRGDRFSMFFQSPAGALNPTLTVERQVGEALRTHRPLDRSEVRSKVLELLELVGIPSPRERLRAYPHELSGGMKQRVLIAMAVALEPELLVADEPTSALDVTIEAQVVGLIKDLRKRMGMAVLFITHDLALAAGVCDEVAVMYGGLIMERAPVVELFSRPAHPYTMALLASRPMDHWRRGRVNQIPGQPPVLERLSAECPFAPRCGWAAPECVAQLPALRELRPGHWVRCVKA
jgi:oligopeptide/dipeptide ABC transporter ATP-binding protein